MTIAMPFDMVADSLFMPAKVRKLFDIRLNKYRNSRNLLQVSGFLCTIAAVLIFMAYEKGICHYDDGSYEPWRSSAKCY